MQSYYYIYGDENAASRPTFDENTPLISMHLKTNSMLKQKNVTTISQQLMHKISNCTKGVAKGDDNPMARSSLHKRKTMKKNDNWDDTSLKLTMENVEIDDNL
jgi:hypothetical protein